MLFLDYVLLFHVAVQRVRRVEDVERVLRWCALSAAGMATFGIVQLLSSNGKFFWFYQYPFSTTSDVAHGSFSNRNHFANFLALGIGPLIWWLQQAMRRARRPKGNAAFRFGSANIPPEERKVYFLRLGVGGRDVCRPAVALAGGIAVSFWATVIAAVGVLSGLGPELAGSWRPC